MLYEVITATSGMHHVALHVIDLEACENFYVSLLGMQVEWRPDADSVYLCSGSDNLALHRVRITSYNVCYTKLLREAVLPIPS